MLKSYGVGWCGLVVWVAHKILVSAQGPLVLDFWFWDLGPGLDNIGMFSIVVGILFLVHDSTCIVLVSKKSFTTYRVLGNCGPKVFA